MKQAIYVNKNGETVFHEDGAAVKVKVTHIGEDYGKVEVTVAGFNPDEYEVPLALALALKEVL